MSDLRFGFNHKPLGTTPSSNEFNKSCKLCDANFLSDGVSASICGRVVGIRKSKNIVFLDLSDFYGKMQISISKDIFGELYSNICYGDFIGVSGVIYTTKSGQKTVECSSLEMLSKASKTIPHGADGVQDPAIRESLRPFLPITSSASHLTIETRIKILKKIRESLQNSGFVEFDTPSVSDSIAFGDNGFSRSGSGLYLRQALGTGFDKVFGFGKQCVDVSDACFSSQEVSMLEWYVAYWNGLRGKKFFEDFLKRMVEETRGDLCFDYQGIRLDFDDIQNISLKDEVSDYLNRDILSVDDPKEIISLLRANSIFSDRELEGVNSIAEVVDLFFRKKISPHISQPTFISDYPIYMDPFSRPDVSKTGVGDNFQLFVKEKCLANGRSELINPEKLRKHLGIVGGINFEDDSGDFGEVVNFLRVLEYGMPPTFGLSMDIDMLVMLLTNSPSIQDVSLFSKAGKGCYSKKRVLPRNGGK